MNDIQFVSNYFQAEQNGSILLIMIGLVLITLTIALAYFFKKRFLVGLAIGVAIIGVIQLVVGITVYQRSPNDTIRVEGYFEEDISMVEEMEIPRVKVVLEQFEFLKWGEISLSILGFLLIFIPKRMLVKGLGMGLCIQGISSLVLDLLASLRAEIYLKQLIEFTI